MKLILPIIVISQFFCVSVWFAGNSILPELTQNLHLGPDFLAHITSAVQFGFITGTFLFALLAISDRFSPSKVFFFSAVLAGLFNLAVSIPGIHANEILSLRFLTGIFLAGIYPVGMKIASDYYQQGLGKSLGFLVGALVLGTAFPHLLKSLALHLPGNVAIYVTSGLCFAGGLCMLLFVPNGPYRRQGQQLHLPAFIAGFRAPEFRSVAFGYFGHMWELYTFWAFVPVMLNAYNSRHQEAHINVSLFSFLIIGIGSLACVVSGLLSKPFGAKKIAAFALASSCLCCLISPLFLFATSPGLFTGFLFVWGITVIADSPLFSTLVAGSAPDESRGTSLTIVNCIGFSITIISIQLINALSAIISPQYIYMLLGVGPVLGLVSLSKSKAA